jgi:hypothetical protein
MFGKLYEQLTEKGKRRFRLFLVLATGSIVLGGIYINLILSGFDPRFLVLILAPAPAFVILLYSSLHKKLKEKVFSNIGFEKLSSAGIMVPYDIYNRGRLNAYEAMSGTVENHFFKMINFEVKIGYGKNQETHNFVGVEFETNQAHFAVQIYDKKNRLKPFFGKVKLESNEFHNYFNVYSKETKHSFYQLDTDTMNDLMDLRKELGFAINIESYLNKILIYVDASVLEKLFKSVLTFSDVLNGEVQDYKLAMYHTSITLFISRLLKIFAVLDYKLAQTPQKPIPSAVP